MQMMFSTSDILSIIAASICIEKETIYPLQNNYERDQTRRNIKHLIEDKLIREYKSKNEQRQVVTLYRLSQKGLQYLFENDKPLYEFYMTHAGNNKCGRTQRHINSQTKIAAIHAIALKAGIDIGVNKPNIQDILNGKTVFKKETTAFYMNKEYKYNETQSKSRAQLSRTAGFIISCEGLHLVYRATSLQAMITKNVEFENNVRLAHALGSYMDRTEKKYGDSIIIGPSYSKDLGMELARLQEDESKKARKCTFAVMAKNKATGSEFLFVPFDRLGINILNIITHHSKEEIKELIFTEEETEPAIGHKDNIDAIVKKGDEEIPIYEFITGNLTSLAIAKSKYTSKGKKVGIVCLNDEKQINFLKAYFDSPNLLLRKADTQNLFEELSSKKKINKGGTQAYGI